MARIPIFSAFVSETVKNIPGMKQALMMGRTTSERVKLLTILARKLSADWRGGW